MISIKTCPDFTYNRLKRKQINKIDVGNSKNKLIGY